MLFELVWNHILCSAGIKNKKQWITHPKNAIINCPPSGFAHLEEINETSDFCPSAQSQSP